MVSSAEAANGHLDVALHHQQAEVARSSAAMQLKTGSNEIELEFDIKDVSLWSPETPNLYELTAHLKTGAARCALHLRLLAQDTFDVLEHAVCFSEGAACRHDVVEDEPALVHLWQ